MNYILSCCSTADLTKEHLDSRDIKYAYFHYYLDDVEYPDDMGQTIAFDKFYQMMDEGADTRTSQINADEFVTLFTPYLKEGKDIVHVTTSSGISGVYNSAIIARDILKEEFPERNVYIIDSLAASSGYGLLMDKLADLRDSGMSATELVAWAEENKKRVQHWFFSTDLKFFVKGGRVSKVAGFVGSILKICPLLNVSGEGKLVPKEKIRLKKNAILAAFEKMKENAENGVDYDGKCYISNSACEEDARELAALIEGYFPKMNGKVEIMSIGTTIGSHTGPGTVALFFWAGNTDRG
jgi:DegV family protein with EDD domain